MIKTFADNNQELGLLSSVAEQLRLLLLQVARTSELAEERGLTDQQLANLRQSSQIGLSLVDHYLLGLKRRDDQTMLPLEPVSLSSLLNEIAHELTPIAKTYGSDLELNIAGKYPPIIANRQALKAALVSLGYGLITGQTATQGSRQSIQLAAHRIPRGMVAGIYSDSVVSEKQLQIGRYLRGSASQPIIGLAPASSAGIFVADGLFSSMGSNLRGSKFQNRRGLAATFGLSDQLRLI